jgi:L-asparaginase II
VEASVYAPLVAVMRSDLEESTHHGAIALADADGTILASEGSPEAVTFLRSSAKPLQAIPLLASGGADHFRLTPAEVAIVIGSHNGEPRHLEAVRSVLHKIGMSESALMCGVHPPYHRETAHALERQGQRPTEIHNNCSGKHAGMLALALFRGEPTEGYFRSEHAVQKEITAAVALFAGLAPDALRLGIDGCTVPTFGMSVGAAATAYARLMDPDRFEAPVRAAAHRAVEAMLVHPEMVGGEGRLDTDLMNAAEGRLVAKAGAEGFYAIGYRREGRGFGLAFKIADGNNDRARTAVLLRALEDLDLLSAQKLGAIAADHLPEIQTRRKTRAGSVTARFTLRR